MVIPPQLEADIKTLVEDGLDIEVRREPPDGSEIFVVIKDYPLPEGWTNKENNTSDLLIRTDVSYPNSKIDMFWMEETMGLKSGAHPQNAEVYEVHIGRRWRRFSWHVKQWNPAKDNIITYLGVIESRLGERV